MWYRVPIVYADGAYEKFPHADPRSPEGVFKVADELCSMVIPWPVAAPTEYLKRTSYMVGNQGDYAMILDTDEMIECDKPGTFLEGLTADGYLVGLYRPAQKESGAYIARLFRIEQGFHHWGAHEVAWKRYEQKRRSQMNRIDGLRISHHHDQWSEERRKKKQDYYIKPEGIKSDEASFRRLVGS